MRHRIAGRRLSRTSEHRLAMRRNLVASLIEHETISTTIEKAKEVKPFVEKLITLAKKGTLHSRRRVITLLGNRDIFDYEDGRAVKKGTIVGKLFSELGPRYLDRPGGYSRIIRLSLKRLGDNGQLVLLQLVGPDEGQKKKAKTTTKRSRRKTSKTASAEQESVSGEKEPMASAEPEQEDTEAKDDTKQPNESEAEAQAGDSVEANGQNEQEKRK
jgi:large subunit ribosomal protein L17